ncbi:MAG TPA: hypothetical protein VES59_07800 [Bacteroidota bacterium]|nr:hypothetical protein [Bacteroidota bacterium]
MLIALAFGFLTVVQAGIAQEDNIVDFYPHADTVCQFPRSDQELTVVCQKKILRRYITFIGMKGDSRILLAAVTLKPLTDVQKSISLSVDFDGIRPNPGKVSTWGYVYDRNGDGRIDYMALVGGAAAYKTADFPDDFPLREKLLSLQQIDYYVGHCKTVFNHWADDNFDGTLDAVIHIDMDPQRDWVERQIVVRSTRFDGKYDEVWSFREKMRDDRDSVKHTATSVAFHPIGKPPDSISPAAFADKTRILQIINAAVKKCGLTSENFYPAR